MSIRVFAVVLLKSLDQAETLYALSYAKENVVKLTYWTLRRSVSVICRAVNVCFCIYCSMTSISDPFYYCLPPIL